MADKDMLVGSVPEAKPDEGKGKRAEATGGDGGIQTGEQVEVSETQSHNSGRRMSLSEYGAAAKADDDRVEQETETTETKPGEQAAEEHKSGIAETMKDLVLKGKTGVSKGMSALVGGMGKMAETLNMSMRLFSIISLILGGSAVSILGVFLLSWNNPAKYLPEADCRVDAIPYVHEYTDNETMPLWSQQNMDSAAHTIYQALSSKDYIQGIIDNGDDTLMSKALEAGEVIDVEHYRYPLPENLGNQASVDASKAHTSASLNDWITILPETDERNQSSSGPKTYNSDIGFTDEAILGMISNAQAESTLNSQIWEGYAGCWFYYPDGSEVPLATSSGGTEAGGKDFAMASAHHRDWNGYVVALQKWWAEQGTDINLDGYAYIDKRNSSTSVAGTQNYYPGVGLWQWTGQRAYGLQEWANMLENMTDSNLDDANDAMYGLNEQIYYAVFENLPAFDSSRAFTEFDGGGSRLILNGDGNQVLGGSYNHLIDWGCMARARYDEMYWANVPNKPAGTNTERIGSRSRVRIPVSNVLSGHPSYDRNYRHDDEVIMPVVDYVYESGGARKINATALESVWAQLVNQAPTEELKLEFSAITDPDRRIKEVMTKHSIMTLTGEYIWWYPFTEQDMLDVGCTDGTNHWGPTMESNGFSASSHSENLSIYYTKVYYDVSVEVAATYSNGTVIMDVDGSNGLAHNTTRPDGAAYGNASGNGIIYESTFENMTGHVASDSSYSMSGPIDYNIFSNSGYGSASLPRHDWVATDSYDVLAKMGRTDQWGDYGSNAEHGLVAPDAYPGWTDASFHAWWNKDGDSAGQHGHKNVGEEYDDAYYRVKLAKGPFEGGGYRNSHPVNCVVTELTATETGGDGVARKTAEYEYCKGMSDQLIHWAEARALAQVSRIAAREYTLCWEGSGNVKHLNSHSQFGSLVHYATMLVDNTWERNDDSAKSMLDLWYENMSNAPMQEWYYSFYHNYCGNSDMGFGGIADMAVAMSWLKGHEETATENVTDRWGAGNYARTLCTELYCAIKCIVGPDDGGGNKDDWDGKNYTRILFSSCDRGVCTSVRSAGADDDFPWGACKSQVAYVKSHPEKWECLGNASSLWDSMLPGDLLLSDHHVIVFVGPEAVSEKWSEVSAADAKYAVCHSSYSGNIDNSRGLRCDPDGRAGVDSCGDFYVYRLVGEPDETSVYKTRVEQEESYLSGLKDGSF